MSLASFFKYIFLRSPREIGFLYRVGNMTKSHVMDAETGVSRDAVMQNENGVWCVAQAAKISRSPTYITFVSKYLY